MTTKLYESLQQEADEILMYDEDYNINARLGLTILIYYTGGGSVAGQRKTLEAAERFYSKYYGYLKMHFWTDMRRFARLNPTAFQNKIDRTIKNAEAGRRLECVLTSDTEYGQRAPEYQFKTLSSHPIDENGLSCLQITLPLSFLSTTAQQQEFEDWAEYVCKQFDIFHGYAGLTIALPDSYYKYQFYEYAVTKRYWGVTPDSDSPITLLWYEGIKSISWYTLEGEVFPDRGEYYKYLQNGTTEIGKGYCIWRLVKRDDGGSVLQASEF